MSITFKVSDVEFNEFKGKDFDHKQLYLDPSMSFIKTQPKERKIVRTSIKEGISKSVGGNSFILSSLQAYNNHHGLTIKPDDVWIAILVQFSLYLNENSEKLRNKIVDFEGKKQLEVVGGGTLMTANYEQLTNLMTKQIEKNIKDPSIREWANKPFTTSTPNDTMAASIALMASVKNFFEYKMSLRCSLPEVTVLGTINDWIDIKNRIEKLKEFDFDGNPDGNCMNSWTELLHPIIDNIIDSVNGNPDTCWWNCIVHVVGGGSGPRYLSGWITAFCVFNNNGKWVGNNKEKYDRGICGNLTTEWIFVDTNEVPKGFLSVPVLIDDNGTEYDTEFFSGHMSISTSNDSKTIHPNIDWCILLK
ncbi:hypothetical protein DDB_G0286039 [Dictyostelium discoideum AX4]|uniref:DUF4419 domain-containing protein n=1 Tax=Dictyostelium discoideum TaxID=44689 RepID=Q54MC5_DICDI|nr:hypothetical protein DDB_G0286039 [Dictyostelium discoideum AX4]EAL64398.1 hypothetical protein DDB_G0286039 [Dictyostelium discoideum AX4]|eukprot:XP_637909.1 hypothetical protein DDB_G0286039 [Dictyostelium discoideum AX4]